MKKNNQFVLATLLAGLTCFATSPAQALTEKEVTLITQSISDAPVADLPAKSAEMVTKAAKKEKQAAKLAPDQLEAIATAAALAAPELADKIVAAIADVYPKAEERVAKAVMLAVPQAQAIIRQRTSGNPEAGIGETYTRTTTKNDGSSFGNIAPVATYAGPGKDPGRN
jgi:hypothetical protein